MGFFDDIETPIDKIPTGFGLPANTYPVTVSGFKNLKIKSGATRIIATYTVNEGELVGSKQDQFITRPERQYAENQQKLMVAAKFAKKALMDLGLDNDDLTEFNGIDDYDEQIEWLGEKVVGTDGTLRVSKNKEGYDQLEFKIEDNAGPSGVSEMSADPVSGGADSEFDLSKFNLE